MSKLLINLLIRGKDDQSVRKEKISYDQSTTFGDLVDLLKFDIQKNDIKLQLENGGFVSLCTHTFPTLDKEPLPSLFMASSAIPVIIGSADRDMSIRIKGLSNESFLIRLHSTDYVSDLKWMVKKHFKINREDMKLTLANKGGVALRDNDTLGEAGVTEFSTVNVTVDLKGGAQPNSGNFLMVDVFNESARRDLQWTYSGPRWMSCGYGLVLEGRCRNSQCEASNQMVCCNKRFGTFDVKTVRATCPICENRITVEDLSFNNCFYQIHGTKQGSDEELRVPWTKVGDVCRCWDKKVARIESWVYMQIVTCQLNRVLALPDGNGHAPVATECSICFKIIENNFRPSDIRLLQCSHSFHSGCWSMWEATRRAARQEINCPQCFSLT